MAKLIGELNKFVSSEGFKRYFKNTSWLFWGKIIQMGMTFLITAYVARYLDDDGFGLLNYAERLGTFFVMFAALGMQSILVRNLVKDKEKRGKIIGTAIIMRMIASSVAVDRTIDVHIRKLREKIGEGYIQTVKGVGYKFAKEK